MGAPQVIFVNGLSFDYAHFLAWHPTCSRLHGHTSSVRVEVEGPLDDGGMVLDFSVLKRITSEVLDRFDHRLLVNAAHLDGTVHAQACVRLRRPTGEETTLSLPASDLVVLDGDSTIENITARVADELFDALVGEHPALRRVTVSCTEGQSKGAVGERHGDPGR